jgi:hypothetical protein
MREFGFDPLDTTRDPATARGVGNLAAQTLLDFRRHDGSNQHGDLPGSDGKPYGDYTGYKPVNTKPTRSVDPDRWQPIDVHAARRDEVHAGLPDAALGQDEAVCARKSAEQFRPAPPPTTTTADALLRGQVDHRARLNRSLSPRQKAIVEFMRDGPRSTGQSGHWLRFAQDISRRDEHSLDQDVKLYFVVANTAFDAFISCWETKRFYDTSRPWTLVRHYYKGQR